MVVPTTQPVQKRKTNISCMMGSIECCEELSSPDDPDTAALLESLNITGVVGGPGNNVGIDCTHLVGCFRVCIIPLDDVT